MNSQKQGFPLRLCWKDRTNRWGRDVLSWARTAGVVWSLPRGGKKLDPSEGSLSDSRIFSLRKERAWSSQERWLSMCCLDVLLFGGLSLFWQVNSYHMNHMKHKYIWMYLRGCFFFVQPSWIKSRKSKKDRWYANTPEFHKVLLNVCYSNPFKASSLLNRSHPKLDLGKFFRANY